MPLVYTREAAAVITDGIIQIDLPDPSTESGWKSYQIVLEDWITANPPDHTLLSNLGWTASEHTGTGDTIPAFNASGNPELISKNSFEMISNRLNAFQETPDNLHYISEKLAKDSLDLKADLTDVAILKDTTPLAPTNVLSINQNGFWRCSPSNTGLPADVDKTGVIISIITTGGETYLLYIANTGGEMTLWENFGEGSLWVGWQQIAGGGGGSYTFNSGITELSGNVQLGGSLNNETTITVGTWVFNIVSDAGEIHFKSATSEITVWDNAVNLESHGNSLSISADGNVFQGPVFLSADRAITDNNHVIDKLYADSRYAGPTSTPVLTDNGAGNGTLSAITCRLYNNVNGTGSPIEYTIASNSFTFTDGIESYVVADYNSGTPIYRVETNKLLINHYSIVTVMIVWREGSTLHSRDEDAYGNALPEKINASIYNTEPYRRSVDGGLILSETQTPSNCTVLVSQSYVYAGVIPENVLAFNSSVDILTEYTQISSVWSNNGNVLVYDNTNYNPPTGKTAMSNNKYSNRFFYRSIGDVKQTFYTLGIDQYNSAELAAAESAPTPPILLRNHCLYIGRIIIQKSGASGSVRSAFAGDAELAAFDLATTIHNATAVTTIDDASEFGLWDNLTSLLRKITWANIKSLIFGGGTFTGEVTFNKTVIQPAYSNTFSASKTIDLSLGNVQYMPVTGDTSITLSNLREGVNMLVLTNDATAGRVVTIDSTFGTKTDNSATHSTVENKVNIYTILKYSTIIKYTIETSS